MSSYPDGLKYEVQAFRRLGKTYGEIQTELNFKIPKSTLSEWCRKISLPSTYAKRIDQLNLNSLGKARTIAVEMNKIKREEFLNKIQKLNLPVAKRVREKDIAKIALSMLCLGEASKSAKSKCFCLGNSDFRIIMLFITLLQICFDFKPEKIRCTVQCRADQDTKILEEYWQKITGVPKDQFKKSRIDPRTIGKPTLDKNYKGVLRVDYFDRKVQLELESLADLVYNCVAGPVV